MRHGEAWSSENLSIDYNHMGLPRGSAGITGCPLAKSNASSYYRLFNSTDGDPNPEIPEEVLKGIADKMIGGRDPVEGEDDEGIPAGYTYFGQFVIHDLTRSRPTFVTDSEGAVRAENLRTPGLDLDSLYGNGPDYDLHLYQRPASDGENRYLFHLGKTAKPSGSHGSDFKPSADDLPRLDVSARGIYFELDNCYDPIVADSRNDDNLILSQLTVLFLRIHNHVASELRKSGKSSQESFALTREFLVKSYRKIVIHDFLDKLLSKEVHEHLTSDNSRLFDSSSLRDGLPLEFVFGAGRIGHAMVREFYRINDSHFGQSVDLGDILGFSSFAGSPNLPLPADWKLEWENFFDISKSKEPQRARRISPFWPRLLRDAKHSLFKASLISRDLSRSGENQIPSGQSCALAVQQNVRGELNIPVLSERELEPMNTTPPMGSSHQDDFLIPLKEAIQDSKDFTRSTPLLYYLIQESVIHGSLGSCLGPLGSYIFAATVRSALAQSRVGASNENVNSLDHAKIKKGVYTMPQLISILSKDYSDIEKVRLDTIETQPVT